MFSAALFLRITSSSTLPSFPNREIERNFSGEERSCNRLCIHKANSGAWAAYEPTGSTTASNSYVQYSDEVCAVDSTGLLCQGQFRECCCPRPLMTFCVCAHTHICTHTLKHSFVFFLFSSGLRSQFPMRETWGHLFYTQAMKLDTLNLLLMNQVLFFKVLKTWNNQ